MRRQGVGRERRERRGAEPRRLVPGDGCGGAEGPGERRRAGRRRGSERRRGALPAPPLVRVGEQTRHLGADEEAPQVGRAGDGPVERKGEKRAKKKREKEREESRVVSFEIGNLW